MYVWEARTTDEPENTSFNSSSLVSAPLGMNDQPLNIMPLDIFMYFVGGVSGQHPTFFLRSVLSCTRGYRVANFVRYGYFEWCN